MLSDGNGHNQSRRSVLRLGPNVRLGVLLLGPTLRLGLLRLGLRRLGQRKLGVERGDNNNDRLGVWANIIDRLGVESWDASRRTGPVWGCVRWDVDGADAGRGHGDGADSGIIGRLVTL